MNILKNPKHLIRFGKRIAVIRKALKKSQKEVTENTSFKQSHLSEIECGKRNLTFDIIIELARILKAHPKDLFEIFIDDLEKAAVIPMILLLMQWITDFNFLLNGADVLLAA